MSELEADLEVGGEVAAADAIGKPGGPWRWIVIGVILAVVGWLLGIVVGDVVGLVALIGFGCRDVRRARARDAGGAARPPVGVRAGDGPASLDHSP